MINFLRFLFVLFVITLSSAIIYYAQYSPFTGIDDAYIYFVYAKNFANGHGFVYNVGGEHVEGFTSMLWLLIVSLFYKISTLKFQWIITAFNVLLISYALYKVVKFIDSFYVKEKQKVISALAAFFLVIVVIVKGYLDWTIFSLLETGMWSSLLILTSMHLMEMAATGTKSPKANLYLGILLGILVFTRPESLLWGVVFISLYVLICWNQQKDLLKAIRSAILPAVLFITSGVALIVFRLQYFGYPFPNTYYAKVSTNRFYNFKEGVSYLAKYLFVYPLYILPLIVMLFTFIMVIVNWKRTRAINNFSNNELSQITNLVIMFTALVIPFTTGGDHFSLFRLYQPLVPVFLLPLFNIEFIKNNFFSKWPRTSFKIALLFLLIPFVFLSNIPKYFLDNVSYMIDPSMTSLVLGFGPTEENKRHSDSLNYFFQSNPKPAIGRITAGGYAFGYAGSTIDLLGLNNTMMAHAIKEKVGYKSHAAFDKKTFYKLKVDMLESLIVKDSAKFSLPENDTTVFNRNFESSVLKNIYRDREFVESYIPVLINSNSSPYAVFTYVRKDYADTLTKKGYTVKPLKRDFAPAN